jgi:hypothetical protein
MTFESFWSCSSLRGWRDLQRAAGWQEEPMMWWEEEEEVVEGTKRGGRDA